MFVGQKELERDNPFGDSEVFDNTLSRAEHLMSRAAEAGRTVPDGVVQAITEARAVREQGRLSEEVWQRLCNAFAELWHLTANMSKPAKTEEEHRFEEAVSDAELLLRYAAETGVTKIPPVVAAAIMSARAALRAGCVTDEVRAEFYAKYAALSSELGEVTAATIRCCSLPATKARLRADQKVAVLLTVVVALVSVLTFMTDSLSREIVGDIAAQNQLAANLRSHLTVPQGSASLQPGYAADPCSWITIPPQAEPGVAPALKAREIEELQRFAAVTRELRTRAIKLNLMVRLPWLEPLECDPLGQCMERSEDKDSLERQVQLNPALINYPAEILCKIKTYQKVRDFANNVQANYAAKIGAVSAYALPILYALLGAYAFRLRSFAETVRLRTYHPSYADSARIIIAIIAGAIAGLFNPAKEMSLPPIAVAFLVGYGVDIFFKLLDSLTSAFGPGTQAARAAR